MNQRNGKDNLDNHMGRCYKCKFCRTYRVRNTGHSKNCNAKIVAKRVKDGLDNGFRRCPVCTIPFKNVIEHLEMLHHLSEEDVDKYRLIAMRGYTAKESIENQKRLKAARQKVIVTKLACVKVVQRREWAVNLKLVVETPHWCFPYLKEPVT